ncbi:hypothetical protein [Streptomyces sp. NPDC090025]|uniref:hypothetical protein n=1 Tax=Streptomyces sp. NPDC090025 TaxID=3365922 RepID=UPI00383816D0
MRLMKALSGFGIAGLLTAAGVAMTATPAAAEPPRNSYVATYWSGTSQGAQTLCGIARTSFAGGDPSGYYWCDNLRQEGGSWAMNLWVRR